jgi:PhnB protein
MIGVQPYINFNGNCREAVDFYIDALGGEMIYTQTYGDSPMKGMAADGQVMHCTFKIGDSHIMACDNPEGQGGAGSSNISLAIGMDDGTRAEEMFARISEGGTVTMPMAETFWAERFGMVTDRFGINWMFNVEKAQGGAQ